VIRLSVLLLLAASTAIFAQNFPLAIVEKKAGAVGFYTPEGKRVAGVKVGEHPHEIVLSPDKKLAYISDNGILWMQYAGRGGNTISIVDLKSRKKVGVINLGEYRRPHGMALDAPRNRLLSTIENPDGLVLIDLNTRQVIRKYDVKGEDPHMVVLSPDGEYAFVSNTSTGTVAVVHLDSGKTKLLRVEKRPQGATRSADGKTIYVTNSEGNSISILDIARQEVTGRIATGKGPGRAVITTDGKTLVYNLQAGEGVGFADIASRKQTEEIRLPGPPLSLTMSPDGRYVYAGVQDKDTVVAISIADRKIVRSFRTPEGAGPDPVIALTE